MLMAVSATMAMSDIGAVVRSMLNVAGRSRPSPLRETSMTETALPPGMLTVAPVLSQSLFAVTSKRMRL